MANKNTLDSWIDRDRMKALLEAVRPGSTRRPSAALDMEDFPVLWESATPREPAETLLAEDGCSTTLSRDRLTIRPTMNPFAPPSLEPFGAMDPRPARAPEPVPPAREAATGPKDPTQLDLDFAAPAGPLEDRLLALVNWVKEIAQAEQVFVVDAYGAALARDPDCDEVFLASVSNLADALGRSGGRFSGPDHGALHLEIGDGQMLSLVQAKWEASTIALGLVRAVALPKHLAARFRLELAKLTLPRRRERD